MVALKRLVLWFLRRERKGTGRGPERNARRGFPSRPRVSATNRWGAALPVVPAGRLFDERVPSNMNERINRELAAGHEQAPPPSASTGGASASTGGTSAGLAGVND